MQLQNTLAVFRKRGKHRKELFDNQTRKRERDKSGDDGQDVVKIRRVDEENGVRMISNERKDIIYYAQPCYVQPCYPLPGLSHTQGFDIPDFFLVVRQNPSPEIVTKRLLKPFPAVMLQEKNLFSKTTNLYVNVHLIRTDDHSPLDSILEGNKFTHISNGEFAYFKKLKVKESSIKYERSPFQLIFNLYQLVDKVYTPLNIVAYSETFMAYTHSSYLSKSKKKGSKPAPPALIEVIPSTGKLSGGDRCCIVGASFQESPKLVVKFGDSLIIPQFHESGCLIITTPPIASISHIQISVANDGKNFSNGFTFTLQN